MEIKLATTAEDVLKCKRVLLELRPHIPAETLVPRVLEMLPEGYQLAFIEENGEAKAVAGFRYLNFLFSGKHFYVDDFCTLPEARGKGYGGALLQYVTDRAKSAGMECIDLDSGYHRNDAHRLYLNQGYVLSSHHFTKKL